MSVRFIQVRSSNLIIFSVSLGLKTDGQTPLPQDLRSWPLENFNSVYMILYPIMNLAILLLGTYFFQGSIFKFDTIHHHWLQAKIKKVKFIWMFYWFSTNESWTFGKMIWTFYHLWGHMRSHKVISLEWYHITAHGHTGSYHMNEVKWNYNHKQWRNPNQ